ncbi:hypothetical protein CspHIS471_0400570 [Cutaneotrichosporon sp. HIS471]|nr:hypothetical protein CspHIS471_0400570 [Cutaneotrichosporon sp. HIS471]
MAERADSDSRSNSKGSPRGGQPSSSTPPTHGRRQGIRPDNRAVQGTMLENEGRGSTRPYDQEDQDQYDQEVSAPTDYDPHVNPRR